MSRYLLWALLAIIGFLTLYGVRNTDGVVGQIDPATDGDRDGVEASPDAVTQTSQGGVTELEQAGQNVTRQLSPEGIAAAQTTTPAQPATVPDDDGAVSQSETTDAEADTSASSADPPAESDAIPALW